jgi:hypothetical protein
MLIFHHSGPYIEQSHHVLLSRQSLSSICYSALFGVKHSSYVSQLWSSVGQFFSEEEQCKQASLILITPMDFHAQSQLLGLWMSIL